MVLGRSWIFFIVLILLSVLGQFATEVYLPSMPSMAKAFNVQINLIQFSIAIYVLGFAIGSLIYGTLSDTLGRKPVIFACLVIGSFGSLVCCLSFTIKWLLIGRFIQGIGFSGVAVIIRSITKDISPNREKLAKIASLIGILNSAAIAFAPVIGGYIEKYLYWRVNFILLLLITVTATFLCWYKIPETNINKRVLTIKIVFKDYFEVLSHKQFLMYNAISTLTLSVVVAYQTISSFLLQVKVGLSPERFGYTSLVMTGAIIIGGVINGRLMPRRGIEKMLITGSYMYIFAGAIYVVTGIFNVISLNIILVPMAIFMVAAGLVYPNCSSGAMSIFDTKAGTAASVYNCLQMVGATIGSVLISIRHDINQLPMGLMLLIVGGVSILCARSLQIRSLKQVTKV